MESKTNNEYHQIMKQMKSIFECKNHPNYKFIAYCSKCQANICEKCLSSNSNHIGHKIYYFKKIMLTEKQVKYYQTLYFLCKYYLNRIREVVIELICELSDSIKNENNNIKKDICISLKSQLKNTYKFFYKMNTYQMYYAKSNLAIYFHCRKYGYINYQIINNIYNIKLSSILIPEIQDKDIIDKATEIINFLKNSKNTNVLKSYESEHSSTFYSYIDYSKNKKVPFYNVKLSSILLNIDQGEIYDQKLKESINFSSSVSNIETDESENNIEIDNNFKKIQEQFNENKINDDNNNLENKKEDNNLKNNNNQINSIKENMSLNNNIKTYKISQINEVYNINNNEIISDNKINIEKNKSKLFKEELTNKETINKNNIKENQNINVINGEKEKIEKIEKINQNEKIKNYIFSTLTKSFNEGVEYRDNIQYIYFDKKQNKKIKCVYYGEFKKGTLKRHGRGLFIWEDGEFYLGYWANDKREGEGTNNYSNGNVYQGSYKNGKKDGLGTYKWENGDEYKGNWKNDMKEGKGIYIYSNGYIYDGYFKMDKIDENKSFSLLNKNTYKSKYKNNIIEKNGITSPNSKDINKVDNQIKIKDNKNNEGINEWKTNNLNKNDYIEIFTCDKKNKIIGGMVSHSKLENMINKKYKEN